MAKGWRVAKSLYMGRNKDLLNKSRPHRQHSKRRRFRRHINLKPNSLAHKLLVLRTQDHELDK